ncbi:hypothetical protein P152DRAFT_461687 [Eremomyces bilateralis CBS 781.70]|uniref:CRIB domain-containing protein n=1 Tax=Eremomyces bilateralis CBS 781.70 TaxID=1392243 RepID=A0A6G1FU83_9PEZI|nr:uncharacterized protein P152DRAFT_461687 [Eremomyces bilateralis CBS 781.70]KAF1809268.1 hypothetical protein P152DRAFT_461687 [Eremomyces bilateralis CBS 781.70]
MGFFLDDAYANRHPAGWDHAAEQRRKESVQQQSSRKASSIISPTSSTGLMPKRSNDKRGSVFQLRSRSNTVTSQTSTAGSGSRSPAPHRESNKSDDSSRRSSSLDGRSFSDAPSSTDSVDAASRSLLYVSTVGKKLKKAAKRPPSSAGFRPEQEKDTPGSKFRGVWNNLHGKEIKIPGPGKEIAESDVILPGKDRRLSVPGESNRKTMISAPSDFQHLVHTGRNDLPSLFENRPQTGPSPSLASEFTAASASHLPKREVSHMRTSDLKADAAPIIESPSFSPSGLSALGRTSTNASTSSIFDPPSWNRRSQANSNLAAQVAPTPSPGTVVPPTRISSPPPVRPIRPVRPARSSESFQFVSMASALPDNPPVQSPPPRRASRRVWTPKHIAEELNHESPTAPQFPADESPSTFGSGAPKANEELPPLPPLPNFSQEQAGEHAPLSSEALGMQSLSFQRELESLQEEPESLSSQRGSRTSMVPDHTTFGSPLRHSRSLPGSSLVAVRSNESAQSDQSEFRSFARPFNHPRPRPVSQMSDTLGATAPPKMHSRRPSTLSRRPSVHRRPSEAHRPDSASWEDVIDMIYEEGGEAHCDFDWSILDADEPDLEDFLENGDSTLESSGELDTPASGGSPQPQIPAKSALRPRPDADLALRPLPELPSSDSLPDLDRRSGMSASTNSIGALTPLDQSYQFPPIPAVPAKDGRRRSPLIEVNNQSDTSIPEGARDPFAMNIDPYSSPFYTAAPTSHPTTEQSTNPPPKSAGSTTSVPGSNGTPPPARSRHSRFSSIDSTHLRDSPTHLVAMNDLRRSNSTSTQSPPHQRTHSRTHSRSHSRSHALDLAVPDACTTALTVDSIVAQLRFDAGTRAGSGRGSPEPARPEDVEPRSKITVRKDLDPQKSEELLIQIPSPLEGSRKTSYGFLNAAASPPTDAGAPLPKPRETRSYSRGTVDVRPSSPAMFSPSTTATTNSTTSTRDSTSPFRSPPATFSPFPPLSATLPLPPMPRPSTAAGSAHKKTVSEGNVTRRPSTAIGKRRGFGHHPIAAPAAGASGPPTLFPMEGKKKKKNSLLASAFGMPMPTTAGLRKVQTATT